MTELELFFLIKTQACFQLSNLQEILSIIGFQKNTCFKVPPNRKPRQINGQSNSLYSSIKANVVTYFDSC